MTRFWTSEKLSELARLANEEKLSVHEIGFRLGRSGKIISQTLYCHGLLTPEELHRRHGDRGRLKRERINEEVLGSLRNHEFIPEMGYCLGALMGDGSIYKGVSNIDVRDEAFSLEFLRCLNKVIDGRGKIRSRHRRQVSFIGTHKVVSDGIYHWVGTCYRIAADFFKSRINETFVLSQSAEFISSFLRGSFDSDGCVPRSEKNNPLRWPVEITVLSLDECHLIELCLGRLNIRFKRHTLKPRDGYQPMSRIRIRARNDILRFSELVGFTTSHRRERLGMVVEAIKGGVR